MRQAPAFVVHTGDVTHLAKPAQFDAAKQVLDLNRRPWPTAIAMSSHMLRGRRAIGLDLVDPSGRIIASAMLRY